MPLFTLTADAALRQLDSFDTVIDARSESEYAQDHLPGALNWPTMNDAERQRIGTMYRQTHAFEANKHGAAIAARNIAAHIEREVLDKPKGWTPLTYCWRGGKRSGALSLVLSQIGFRVTLIEGGYKAFRNALLQDIPRLVQPLDWRVVCGATGSGKTRLLHALAQAGAQVLDLEALACHRSSVLGAIPGVAQPSQKAFDTRIWDALRRLDPARPVYVESESKKVGNVAIPAAVVDAMRAAPCLNLRLPDDERVALLMEDYAYFVQHREALCERLDALTELRGKQVVAHWKAQVQAGQIDAVVRDLLLNHYDPGYQQSMARNFQQYAQAQDLPLTDRQPATLQSLAQTLMGTAYAPQDTTRTDSPVA